MTTILSHDAFNASISHAFGELLVLEQISQLPPESVLRVLQSFPRALLEQALAEPEPQRPAAPRRKVLRGGKVMLGGAVILEVQLREIGEDGGLIWTRWPDEVPEQFSLRIVGIDGEKRCRVAKRAGEEIDVRFLNP
jgi:hypothetical protein